MNKEETWYQLDTAANLYPAIVSSRQVSIFRLSCTLTEKIDPEILQTALLVTLERFPTFNVRLKRGAFWNYFETNTNKPIVLEESGSPCQLIELKKNDDFLFRVTWFDKRINLEIFHALSDGGGGMEFLKSLVYYYLKLQEKNVFPEGMIKTLETKPDAGEIENSFLKYYDPSADAPVPAQEKAYHIKGKPLPANQVRVIQGIVPVDQLLSLSRSMNVKMTEYLTAILIKAYFNTMPEDSDPKSMINISVPINLRNLFPSTSVRNFSFYVIPAIRFDKRDLPLADLVEDVKKQVREMAKKENLQPRINPDVAISQNAALRFVPLDAKNKMIKMVHQVVGEDLFTCSLSNLGPIKLPESMNPYVTQFDFILSASGRIATNCSMCSFKNTQVISFVSNIEERTLEREFFRLLAEQGLSVRIESNEN